MKAWGAIVAVIASILAQGFAYFTGGRIARNKVKLKGLKNKVVRLETENEVDEMSDDDIATQLSEWVPRK